MANQGFAIWLTGLPSSGKSSLAAALREELAGLDVGVQILDSDEMRKVLTPQPTYSHEERDWFYGVMVYIGHLLTDNGANVIFAATANKRCHRAWAREAIEKFVEVHVKCPLETCMSRDHKGVYAKALAGEATTVPGLQDPYEPPKSPEVVVETDNQSPQECARQIVARLEELTLLSTLSACPPPVRTGTGAQAGKRSGK
ncbi:MAG: adenylyl-sulfate kinase [Chloroflexota bacterium]|nr:adenylyl-sulfate kinase [Chloroflexota bacterium]